MQKLTSHINQSLNSGLYLQKVGTKSVHFRYTIRGILKNSQNKKASIRSKSRLFMWGLKESNLRPSACKADALNQLS